MDKFNRSFELLIQEGVTKLTDVPLGKSVVADRIKIEPPFTIDFDIIRNILTSANTTSIRVYNLSEKTRDKIYKDQYSYDLYKSVILNAGYTDQLVTIFKGNITQAYSVREGINFVTTIEAYDGGFAFVNSKTSKTIKKGTPKQDVLATLMKELAGTDKGKIGLFPGSSSRGNALVGNTTDLLSELSSGAFFIDLETAHVLGDDEYFEGNIPVITSKSGLLGTPKRSGTTLVVDILFEPRMTIGQSVVLDSSTGKNFNGLYKVVSVQHKGTISEASAGQLTTSLGLWLGAQGLRKVN